MSLTLPQRISAVARAQRKLSRMTGTEKNSILSQLSSLLAKEQERILAANRLDLAALAPTVTSAYRDRLALNPERLANIAASIASVCAQPDPVGEVESTQTRADGLEVKRVRAPIGTLFIIFESRPNVALDAFVLALKSGNAVILRGGSEAARTVSIFYELITEALTESGHWPTGEIPFYGVEDYNRARIPEILAERNSIDLVIPRGGEALIRFVCENTEIPVLKNDRGLCHVYVHASANLVWASAIVKNAKTQRPGVCNSMETLLVDRAIAPIILAKLSAEIDVEWRCCPESFKIVSASRKIAASEKDWDTEHLDLVLNCRIVSGIDDAIAHIVRHGSKHSEAIVADDENAASRFVSEIDAAAVYVNASTRFTDGGEMGLGAEIGISTQKIHARGPIGARELTTARWVARGKGTVRK